ncbi:MAG: hypothetical protein ACYDCL_17000 [Myxococcales bacterium]
MYQITKRWLRAELLCLTLGGMAACPASTALPAPVAPAAPSAAPPAAPVYAGGPVARGGTIAGRVTLAGAAPAPAVQMRNRDLQACSASGPDETLQVGAGNGIKDVIVSLTDVRRGKALRPMEATLDQRRCAFVPHVQAVPVGTTLTVASNDPVLHNVRGSMDGRLVFNYALRPGDGKTPRKKLNAPGIVRLSCAQHGWMDGAIGVMENPYFAVTGEDGAFELTGVPAGAYTLRAWHETLGERETKVTVPADGVAAAGLEFAAGH